MRIIVLAVLAVVLAGCAPAEVVIEGETVLLKDVEVREYEGERLDSADAFRENSIKGPQDVNIEEYRLEITGLVDEEKAFTYEEALDRQKYSKVVTLYCVEGWNAKVLWEGVLVKELIDEAGVQEGANTIIFHAVDGYTTSLPLDYIIDNDIMIAYKINNITLPPERGYPFHLIAEKKHGYKWIRWLNKIELSDDPEYRGYWESRGYSNTADEDGPIFKD